MKTYFHIKNTEFTEYLKITAQEKEYCFCDDLTIEYDDCDILNVDVELINAEEYYKFKYKNLFFKLLLNIVKFILAPLIYYIDNNDGIGLDKGYYSFNPFSIKQSISIYVPDEKVININYIDSNYDKTTKIYSPPSIEFQYDDVVKQKEEIVFSETLLKQEWNTYHIPAFTIIMIVILLLNWLNFSMVAQVVREMSIYPMPENVSGVIGMSFCSIVMIALLVAYIVVIVKAYRLQKEVINKNI